MDHVFHTAVTDFYENKSKGTLLIHNTYGEPDEMPLDVYFRKEHELSDLELFALEHCQGKVLDVGAALGALTLILQEYEFEVEALEISDVFCEIMKRQGVKSILNANFLSTAPEDSYDTLLMMMNGFGLCGSFAGLPEVFKAIDRYLSPGGQVILASSDISYLYGKDLPEEKYYGEMDYAYEYAGEKGPWFKWLYIDSETLSQEAKKHGFDLQVLFTEETGQYLGRLTRQTT